jgi:glycosyltransferase involved in cell wall biosynthesis
VRDVSADGAAGARPVQACAGTLGAAGLPVAILIPAYNEARTLRPLVERALAVTPHVIVVDDGSTDGTAASVAGLPIELLANDVNRGKGASLWRGMQHAIARGAAYVVTIDADGQHRPEDAPRLVEVARRHPHSMVIGSRLHDRANMPAGRYWGNKAGLFWISWAAGQPIPDAQSGFRVYPAGLVRALAPDGLRAQRFAFESEIIIRAAALGYPSIPEPIPAIYLTGGRKSHYRLVVDTLKIIAMVTRSIVSRGFYLQGLWRSLRGPKWDGRSRIAGKPAAEER